MAYASLVGTGAHLITPGVLAIGALLVLL